MNSINYVSYIDLKNQLIFLAFPPFNYLEKNAFK